mgnify:CR=1 FL=1
MAALRFGPAGVPNSAKKPTTPDGIRRCRELGLGCMEMEFVQRVSMGEETAREVAVVAAEADIVLSSHAPYYVNLNSAEEQKVIDSVKRIMQAARITALCGGTGTVFHAAFYQGTAAQAVYDTVKGHLQRMRADLGAEGFTIALRPETTGKESQFGTVDELLRLSVEIPACCRASTSATFMPAQAAPTTPTTSSWLCCSRLNACSAAPVSTTCTSTSPASPTQRRASGIT